MRGFRRGFAVVVVAGLLAACGGGSDEPIEDTSPPTSVEVRSDCPKPTRMIDAFGFDEAENAHSPLGACEYEATSPHMDDIRVIWHEPNTVPTLQSELEMMEEQAVACPPEKPCRSVFEEDTYTEEYFEKHGEDTFVITSYSTFFDTWSIYVYTNVVVDVLQCRIEVSTPREDDVGPYTQAAIGVTREDCRV